ncbi:MAG: hypothetical protein Q9218_001735 [Villophora microphyllina]
MELSDEMKAKMAKPGETSFKLPVRSLVDKPEKAHEKSAEHKMEGDPVKAAVADGGVVKNSASDQQNGHKAATKGAGEAKKEKAYIDLTEGLGEEESKNIAGQSDAGKDPFAKQFKEVEVLSGKEQTLDVCHQCFGLGPLRCQRCGAAYYCSSNCQRVDWPEHKQLCKGFAEVKDPPESGYVRALYFPADESGPRWIWLMVTEDPLDMDFISESLEVQGLLGVTDDREIGQQRVNNTLRRAATWDSISVESRVYLLTRQNCFEDGSKPNRSVGTVTKGQFLFSWRGPIIAVLIRSEITDEDEEGHSFFDHLEMIDYRDLMTFFKHYGMWEEGIIDFAPTSFWWLSRNLREELGASRAIEAVIATGEVEAKKTGKKYRPFLVPEGHPALAFLQPCPITVSLGLPLLMRRAPTEDAFKEEAEKTGNRNFGPRLLEICIDPKSREWGTTPEFNVCGNMVIIRQDMKELHPHHVEAMLAYLGTVVFPAIQESVTGGRSKKEVLEMLHPSRFDWFFLKFRKEQGNFWAKTPDIFKKTRS